MQDTAFSRFMAQLTDQPRPYAPDTSVPRLMGRDKFTRLPCLTWFRDAIAPGAGPVGCVNPPAWLGEVPSAWVNWHNPAVVQALDERLGWLLVHPVNTERGREGLLRVQVMGVHVLEVDKQRPQWLEGMPELVDFNMPMRVFEWGVSADDAPALLERGDDHRMWILDRHHAWLKPFHQGLVDALMHARRLDGEQADQQADVQANHQADGLAAVADDPAQVLSEAGQYAHWLLMQWCKTHWSRETWRSVAQLERTTVTGFLQLDEAMVAHALVMHAPAHWPMRLEDWVGYRLGHELDTRLLEEAPHLLLLRLWMGDILPPELERTAAMKWLLCEFNVQPAMWGLLHAHGCAWMKAFMPYFLHDGPPCIDQVVELLILAQAFGTSRLVEPALLHGLMSLRCSPNAPRKKIAEPLQDLFDLCVRMGVAWQRGDGAVRREMVEMSHAVFQWANNHWDRLKQSTRSHIGWPGIRSHVLHWQARECLKAQALPSYGHALALRTSRPDWVAVVLNSGLEVWEEGYRMRHCAYRYQQGCQDGQAVMVSVRRADNGKGLATALMGVRHTTQDGDVKADEQDHGNRNANANANANAHIRTQVRVVTVSGRANTKVAPQLCREIAALARQLQVLLNQPNRVGQQTVGGPCLAR